MEKAVHVARDDLAGLRTGRANASAFARLVVDYYGAPTPIPQMATVNVPEARMAMIKPYDASQLNAIEKAMRESEAADARGRAPKHAPVSRARRRGPRRPSPAGARPPGGCEGGQAEGRG